MILQCSGVSTHSASKSAKTINYKNTNLLLVEIISILHFKIYSRYDVIPVVYGYGDYAAQAPPHSYIDVLDFPKIEDLANYLIYLDKNDTAYYEYFR